MNSNKSDKTSESAVNNTSTWRGLMRGLSSGILVPVVALPLDKLHTHFVVDHRCKYDIKTLRRVLQQPFKGYAFVASTNAFRYSVTFVSGPLIEKQLCRLGLKKDAGELLGFAAAGSLEAVVGGPISFIKQKILLNSHSATQVVRGTTLSTMVSMSWLTTRYHMLKNAVFWPAYNKFLQYTDTQLHVNTETNAFLKCCKEFTGGAAAGIGASFLSYPIDVLQKKHIEQSHLTIKQLVTEAYHLQRWKIAHQFFYRGLSYTPPRIAITMGVVNIAIKASDSLHDQFFTPSLNQS